MAYQKYIDEQLPLAHSPCAHLRSKEMYVTGQREPDDLVHANKHFCWCNLTQHKLGPDSASVGRGECAPARDCYRPS
jgi:hypothetical protein